MQRKRLWPQDHNVTQFYVARGVLLTAHHNAAGNITRLSESMINGIYNFFSGFVSCYRHVFLT